MAQPSASQAPEEHKLAGTSVAVGLDLQLSDAPGRRLLKIKISEKPKTMSEVPPASTKTVLCVDDDAVRLHIRELVLKAEGYSVITASNATIALLLSATEHIDAAVLDYAMPGVNGARLAGALKAQKPDLPVIMLSAHTQLPDDARAYVDAFVTKGSAPTVLLTHLANLLRIRTHHHPEMDGDYIVFADRDRRYLEVSDGVCRLLGYDRAELLDMTIDDVSASSSADVNTLWEDYRNRGYQQGQHTLKTSSGARLRILYRSRVFPDGCMVAAWQPL